VVLAGLGRFAPAWRRLVRVGTNPDTEVQGLGMCPGGQLHRVIVWRGSAWRRGVNPTAMAERPRS